MDLFATPLRVGETFDWDDDHVCIDIRDAHGGIVATVYGTTEVGAARASWFVLHANARVVQPAPGEQDRRAALARASGRPT